MTKVNRILLGVLAVQLVLVAVFSFGTSDLPSMQPMEPIAGGLDAEQATRLTIYADGSDEAAIDLEQRGEAWVLRSHDDYPADAAAVKRVIGKIAGLAARAPTATGGAKQKQLEVAPGAFQRKLVVGSSGGDTVVYLGTETGFRQTAVRLEDAEDIYTVRGLSAGEVPAEVADWIDPVYVDLASERVVGLTVENAGGVLTLQRGTEGTWTLAPEEGDPAGQPRPVDSETVSDLLADAGRIEIEDLAGTEVTPEQGFAEPRARVTLALETAPGSGTQETYVIEIGADQDGQSFVRALDRKHVVLVDSASVTSLVDLDEAALPEPPPAPETEGAGGGAPPPGFP